MTTSVEQVWKAVFSLVLLLASSSLGSRSSEVYHITSSSSDPCPAETCLTLSQFANNSNNCLGSNTTLIFLLGNHSLEAELFVDNIDMLLMLSNSTSSSGTVIVCSHNMTFKFDNVSVVHISGLTFVGCSGNSIKSVNQFVLEESNFIGQNDLKGTALEIIETFAHILRSFISFNRAVKLYTYRAVCYYEDGQNKAQAGGAIVSIKSNVTVIKSVFERNSAGIGGAIFSKLHSNITIINSTFEKNHAANLATSCFAEGGVLYAESGSIVVIRGSQFINNSAEYVGGVLASRNGTYVTITDSEFIHNRGGVVYTNNTVGMAVSHSVFISNSAIEHGGAVYAITTDVFISHSKFVNNRATDVDGKGGAVSIQALDVKSLLIMHSQFIDNSALTDGGVVIARGKVSITIVHSEFVNNNAARRGGVLHMQLRFVNVTITHTKFIDNSAAGIGGVVSVSDKEPFGGTVYVTFAQCEFINNSAKDSGGVIFTTRIANTTITQCEFILNSVEFSGGVMYIVANGGSNTTITHSEFHGNTAASGGVIYEIDGSILVITHCEFINNTAISRTGGVLSGWSINEITITYSQFIDNGALKGGVVFYSSDTELKSYLTIVLSKFVFNSAVIGGGVLSMHSDYSSTVHVKVAGNIFLYNRVSNNGGAVATFKGTLTISNSSFDHNSAGNDGGVLHLKQTSTRISGVLFRSNRADRNGGAVYTEATTTIKTNDIIQFEGNSTLMYNHAEDGGALYATKSNVYVRGVTTIANNNATATGGGVYLGMSELYCQGDGILDLSGNFAAEKGGGVHLVSSTINVIGNSRGSNVTNNSIHSYSRLYFVKNEAEMGGGLSMETNAKLYILKPMPWSEPFYVVNFTANSATYGGAVYYLSDDSNLGLCDPYRSSYLKVKECFIQSLAIYNSRSSNIDKQHMSITNFIFFSRNSAHISGSSLFGELNTRCKIHHFIKNQKLLQLTNISSYQQHHDQDTTVNGVSYVRSISNIDISDIGSQPVLLCFCKHGEPVCNYQPDHIRVIKGKRFSVELAAVDQVYNPVNATIYSSLSKTGGGLLKGQNIQNTVKACTKLKFNLFSPSDKEELIMNADGPCAYSPYSQRRLNVQFTACDSCPVGFEKHVDETTVCECICDSKLEPYITKCNASTELLEREGSFWITYINTSDNATSGYLIYPQCPFNYCLPPTSKVEVNLNVPNGDDAQCADGRSGTLCGTCQSNLSLSLGSSRCIPCSSQWPLVLVAIVIAAFIAGILLVTLLLVLNLTVAVGTLNGVTFYANVVAANGSTFLPFSEPNFVTVLVSWLNLELGFDTCFFPGMDGYWKTLLQLAFPMYVIFLVVMVITISEHSTKFARLVAKRNPVATLATLILLSYAKFLNTTITSLSFAVLDYPDGSHHIVWLPDATVAYLSGKHIVLFIIAVVILLAGAAYTTLLVSWQWLLQHQHKKIFTWTRHQKLCHFIEPYHAPYTFEQRYWTGLLLLVRVVLYTVSAVNVTGDPRVPLVSTVIVVGCLPAVKGILERKIYKIWLLDVTEIITYINIIAFSTLTLYTFDSNKNQTAIAYTSVMITFALLLAVVTFHVAHYAGLFSITQKIAAKFLADRKRHHVRRIQAGTPSDINIDEDYQPLITQSVVEVPSPSVELERLLKDEEIITPIGTKQVGVMEVVSETAATAQLEEEAFIGKSPSDLEADQLECDTLSAQTETTEIDLKSLSQSSDHMVISSTPPTDQAMQHKQW